MKVIFTGVTGYVGAECVRQALRHKSITQVVALSRRPLKEGEWSKDIDTSDPKLKVVIMKDFLQYPPDVMQELEGADACVWNLGTTPKKHSKEETIRTGIDFPMAAADAWNGKLKPKGSGPFTFVLVSGFMTERDQDKRTWFPARMDEMCHIRGDGESKIVAVEAASPETFKAFVLGMAAVIDPSRSIMNMLPMCIRLNEAAACMLELALNGYDKQHIYNTEMKAIGQKALAKNQ